MKKFRVKNKLYEISSEYRLLQIGALFSNVENEQSKLEDLNASLEQLHYLSTIDKKFSRLIMEICLDVELVLKTSLINDAKKLGVAKDFAEKYLEEDKEYLIKTYPDEMNTLLKVETEFLLEKLLDFVLFGTLEKIIVKFYSLYQSDLNLKNGFLLKSGLNSVRHLRNRVAHNVPLLADFNKKCNFNNSELYTILYQNGLKKKTVKNNLSKNVIFDFCVLLFLCNSIITKNQKKEYLKKFNRLFKYCKKYKKYYKHNLNLISLYNFLKKSTKIFLKKLS